MLVFLVREDKIVLASYVVEVSGACYCSMAGDIGKRWLYIVSIGLVKAMTAASAAFTPIQVEAASSDRVSLAAGVSILLPLDVEESGLIPTRGMALT